MKRMIAVLSAGLLLFTLSAGALAAPVLHVVETPGDYYTITAQDSADPATQYWRIKVDIASGGIYSFVDLTDVGDGAGGHTDYLGASAYGRQCTMLYFDGRGGNVCTRNGSLAGLADRLTFDAAPDGSAFTITYTETVEAEAFFHNSYTAADGTLTPGDLLTTISVVIRPPTGAGTFWDWSIACENVCDHPLSSKIPAAERVKTWLEGSIAAASDVDQSRVDGPYEEANLVSYARWTIGDNAAMGLAEGRQFILDYQAGLSVGNAGGTVDEGSWAGFSELEYNSPFHYSTNQLGVGETQVRAGQFVISIAGSAAGAPVADAGPDQTPTAPTPDGVTVTLDGSASSDDGTIVSYEWAENGSPIATGVSPQATLSVGFHVITLTVTDDQGLSASDTVVVDVALAGSNRLFYVDFENGDDANHGRSPAAAWKHSPGDINAAGGPAGVVLAAGDKVIFKGGVHYRGTITINGEGDASADLVFDGNTDGTFGDGRAVVDGSEPLTGWTAVTSPDQVGGNPNWAGLYYADLPAGVVMFTENMYEDDQLLTMAQGPDVDDPRYYDAISTYRSVPETDVTNTSITDPGFFTQTDPSAWDGAYIHVWANPNQVFTKAVTGYAPATGTIMFETVSPGLYTDRPTLYAMTNSFLVLDAPGEYVIDEAAGRVYLWPLSEGDPAGSEITVSVRRNGIDFYGSSYVTVQGFKVIKHSSPIGASRSGSGIRNYVDATNLTVRDNEVCYQRSMEKYGGIYLTAVDNSIVTGNNVHDNVRNRGIMCTGIDNVVSENTLSNNGGTGIYTPSATRVLIYKNTVLDHTGTHANGITLYQGNVDGQVIGNVVLGGYCALTTQDANGVKIAYNVLSRSGDGYTVAEWGGGTHVSTGLEYYNNVIANPAGGVAFAISEVSQVGVVVKNNIIDGGGPSGPTVTHNIYTSLSWAQDASRGWSLGEGEIVEFDKTRIFVDPVNEDYRLIPASPAIDAGTDVGYTVDLLGAAVPQGNAVDIGPYEGGVSPDLPGDADRDGDVDLGDFVILKTNFGSGTIWDEGDFDGDGDVDLNDFVILKTNFGRTAE